MSVPALVSVKGVLTNGVWTLFWKFDGQGEKEFFRYVLRESI